MSRKLLMATMHAYGNQVARDNAKGAHQVLGDMIDRLGDDGSLKVIEMMSEIARGERRLSDGLAEMIDLSVLARLNLRIEELEEEVADLRARLGQIDITGGV